VNRWKSTPPLTIDDTFQPKKQRWEPVWGNIPDELRAIIYHGEETMTWGPNNVYNVISSFEYSLSPINPDGSCAGTIIRGITTLPFFWDHLSPSGFFANDELRTDYTCRATCETCPSPLPVATLSGMKAYGLTAKTPYPTGSEVYQGMKDFGNGNIAIRMAGITDPTNGRVDRFEVKGNVPANQFTLVYTKDIPVSNGFHMEVAGTGVTQGANQHFLFRVTSGSHSNPDMNGTQYYCYHPDIDWMEMPATVSTSECESYESTVNTLVRFGLSDIPSAVFDKAINIEDPLSGGEPPVQLWSHPKQLLEMPFEEPSEIKGIVSFAKPRDSSYHYGMDLKADLGSTDGVLITSPVNASVHFVTVNKSNGPNWIIDIELYINRQYTVLLSLEPELGEAVSLDDVLVTVGDEVTTGQLVAIFPLGGNPQPHLHYQYSEITELKSTKSIHTTYHCPYANSTPAAKELFDQARASVGYPPNDIPFPPYPSEEYPFGGPAGNICYNNILSL